MHVRRLAIWDVDGTLVDSRAVIQACMESAFRESGLPPPDYDDTRKIVGLSLHAGIALLAPPDLGALRLDSLVDSYRQAFIRLRANASLHEPMYEGALELLDRMRQDGWLMAIATGKTHRGLDGLFAKHTIKSYFDTIWCADDGPGKPDPFMVEQAMRTTGCDASESLMIGDAIHDIRMGRAAGVRTLGVSWGFGRTDELELAGADEIHHDFESLHNRLVAGMV